MNEAECRQEQQLLQGSRAACCMEGDVMDGSVDYYDFEWGEQVPVDEASIFCGCSGSGVYAASAPCPRFPACEPEPCVPVHPAGQDDGDYAMIQV